MKIKFDKRKDDNNIEVLLKDDQGEKIFSYVELIKYLHNGNHLEEAEYTDSINDEEKIKINQMINKINDAINCKNEVDKN